MAPKGAWGVKRWRKALLAAAVILGVLLAIQISSGLEERSLSGEITRVWTGVQEGKETVSAFTLRTEQGRELGFRINEATRIFDGPEDYKEGNVVLVTYRTWDKTLPVTGSSGQEIKTYHALDATVVERLERGAVTLEDGTELDVLHGGMGSDCYKLPGGKRLLYADSRESPERSFVGGLESFEDLSPTAQGKVRAYYEEQGCLYDLDRELERAWKEYQERGEDFQPHWVGQDVSPSASGERVMYFVTTVRLPLEGNVSHELQLCAAFDRETGEQIPTWDLFTCPEEEAVRAILDGAEVKDEQWRSKVETALKPENILFFQEHMALYFDQGTLPGEENAVVLSVDYDKLGGSLQTWAVPGKGEGA